MNNLQTQEICRKMSVCVCVYAHVCLGERERERERERADLIYVISSSIVACLAQFCLAGIIVHSHLANLTNKSILPDDLAAGVAGLGPILTNNFKLMAKHI